MARKKSFSLATKLNLIVIVAILVVSAGLVHIAYVVNGKQVDERYAQDLLFASESTIELLDPAAIDFIWEHMQTDDFRKAATAARESNDETPLIEWMSSIDATGIRSSYGAAYAVDGAEEGDEPVVSFGYYTDLYDAYCTLVSTLDFIRDAYDVSSARLQCTEDGATYIIADPELGVLSMGAVGETVPKLAAYDDNERIPPTIYKGSKGWVDATCEPVVDDESGKTPGTLCLELDMNEAMAERGGFLLSCIVYVLAISAVVTAVSVYLIRRFVSKPLQNLATATSGFCEADDSNLEDSIIEVTVRSDDEIGMLNREINLMQERIVNYTERIQRGIAEKERVVMEMEMASKIQDAMLPNIFPCFPEREEFDIYASMETAKEVGGDFYDFFLVDENRLAMLIADVSGKGIPAALFMMATKIMIFDRAKIGGTPAEILTDVNIQICENNPTRTFVSVWMGILDIATGVMTCTNAGHLYPWIRHAGGAFEMLRDKHGFVVGGVKRSRYTDYQLQLNPGDVVFVYTDGVIEARNEEREFFGEERLDEALNSCDNARPEEVLAVVSKQVHAFVSEADSFDDLTMMCLEYSGVNDVLMLPATVGSIPYALTFVEGKLDELNCPSKAKAQLLVAIDEILSNIARFAYEGRSGPVSVRFGTVDADRIVELTFTDKGLAYNPLETEEPDVTLAARDRKVGGLGIFIVRKTVDEVVYERQDDKNVLIIRKRIAE